LCRDPRQRNKQEQKQKIYRAKAVSEFAHRELCQKSLRSSIPGEEFEAAFGRCRAGAPPANDYSLGNRRGCPANAIPSVISSKQLFLFAKLNLFPEQLRVVRIFPQERNYRG
jgi:hypothetical protein